ncbi:hypothetical protein C0993_000987 [Termitomyces sp. T159_Od127]|nr:hypothetical protein C0993_000987 [Termitomyces sp. T159_Od127]
MASILEAAAAQGCDVESIVGARQSQASGPTRSVPASSSVQTITTAPSSPTLVAGPFNNSMTPEMALYLVADSTSVPQDNVTVRREGVTVNSMFMSENNKRAPAHVCSALSNETFLNASPIPTNEISNHKASTSGSYSIQAHSVFAGNGAQTSALACHNQPAPFTPRSGPDSFTSITTGGTTASSVEMDMDGQDISTSQVNTPWLLSPVGIPTNSCGPPTASIVNTGSSSDFMQTDHAVCVFGSDASDCNTWNGSSNCSASFLDQSANALDGRSKNVSTSSWSERPSSCQAAASRPSFSNNPINVHSATHESCNTHDGDPFAHISKFDFRGSGYFNIDTWSSPSDANLADPYNSSLLSVHLASNDVEMESYDPLSGRYGVEESQISASSFCPSNHTTDPHASDNKIVATTSDEQKIIYDTIDVEIEKDPSLLPFRQRLAPPPVELSSLDLDPQLDWVQDSSALSSPESPAAAVIYDHFSMVIPSSFDDSDENVQYIPFPWPISGRLVTRIDDETDETKDDGEKMDGRADEAKDQPQRVQTIRNEEIDDQSEWQQIRQLGFYPLPVPAYPFSGDEIRQTDSSFQHRQSRDTSCFRPLKKLATAVGWAVHHCIGHRVQCDYP